MSRFISNVLLSAVLLAISPPVIAQRSGPPPPAAGRAFLTPLEEAVQSAFQREFGEHIPRPVIYNDERSVDCLRQGHLTSVAYLPNAAGGREVLTLFMSRDATMVLRRSRTTRSVLPAGVQKVGVVIFNYPATTGGAFVDVFRNAQEAINEQHQRFAQERRLPAPLVQFANTNVVAEPSEVRDPRNPSAALTLLRARGLDTNQLDIVMVIDIDPDELQGGSAGTATRPGRVYVGNFSGWTRQLERRDADAIAATAYHHEVGHLWGWDHDWTPSCGGLKLFDPFITAPGLFGWEDHDGDGVVEILDRTPYGWSR